MKKCPRSVGTRGIFLARLLDGVHPQTKAVLPTGLRRVVTDGAISGTDGRRRVNGKQVPTARSEGHLDLSVPIDFSALDEVTASCGYAEALDSDAEELLLSAEAADLFDVTPAA